MDSKSVMHRAQAESSCNILHLPVHNFQVWLCPWTGSPLVMLSETVLRCLQHPMPANVKVSLLRHATSFCKPNHGGFTSSHWVMIHSNIACSHRASLRARKRGGTWLIKADMEGGRRLWLVFGLSLLNSLFLWSKIGIGPGAGITGAHVQYLTHPSFVVVVVVAALTHGGWCADHRLWTSSVPSAWSSPLSRSTESIRTAFPDCWTHRWSAKVSCLWRTSSLERDWRECSLPAGGRLGGAENCGTESSSEKNTNLWTGEPARFCNHVSSTTSCTETLLGLAHSNNKHIDATREKSKCLRFLDWKLRLNPAKVLFFLGRSGEMPGIHPEKCGGKLFRTLYWDVMVQFSSLVLTLNWKIESNRNFQVGRGSPSF